ncbi:MAG: RNA chaperone Hfq [Bacillota bacterium]|nr:RNA chaperone Hfq [Bacillota bacterium]
MMQTTGLQEQFLNALRQQKSVATLFLVNGFQMKGILKAFDAYTLLIDSGGMQQMVFKHAISTIIPQAPIVFTDYAKTEL